MLECGLRAVVLHNKEVVWNYYAEFTADCRRINTKAKKLNRNYGNMSGETIEKSLKMVFEQSDAGSIILGFFFNSGVHTVFGFKYDTQKYGYVESMSWNCQEHHYLVYSNGVYTFTSA